jgi:site-specific DNA-methyltransferase (adenine-specific)
MAEDSVDAVVTDPPYELGFMGKSWDASGIAFCPDTWRQVLRVMKPGAHLVAFGAPKNYHRLACAIEDAGFEIRDSLMWVFGTGFPKSANVSKQIDKAAGAEREVVGFRNPSGSAVAGNAERDHSGSHIWTGRLTSENGITDDAKNWQGWGTALKPAYEPIVLARKPLSEKTVAANVLRWGTGALNIDATRVGNEERTYDLKGGENLNKLSRVTGNDSADAKGIGAYGVGAKQISIGKSTVTGRWPANLCHDGSQMVLDLFPHTKSGTLTPNMDIKASTGWAGGSQANRVKNTFTSNEGSAARFFYSAKASKTDRAGSKHPTVKPVSLMQWLVRMVTPPNGTVLDLFAGSGTTGQAAINEGFNAILIEREAEYINDIKNRLSLEIKEAV